MTAEASPGLFLAAERPQQLDDLLWVPPWLACASAIAQAIQFVADLYVRLALSPQTTALEVNLGVDGPEFVGDDAPELRRRLADGVGAGQEYPKQGWKTRCISPPAC